MSRSSAHKLDYYVPRSAHYGGKFGRMFRIPAWVPPDPDPDAAVAAIEQFASDNMAERGNDPLDNINLPAGYTYFGQFVDHDITFDPTSSLERENDPDLLRNFRTPRLDLDCLYGEGPDDEPFTYDDKRKGMFLIGTVSKNRSGDDVDSTEPDLPRNAQGRALIGDMRNDENVIVSQFQLAMLRLHNRIYLHLIGEDPNQPPAVIHFTGANKAHFHEAQRIVRYFYQYVTWNDFVRRLVPASVWSSTLVEEDGRLEYRGRFYRWRYDPFIPVEFSVAAYRFGHSLIRPGYQVNNRGDFDLGFGVERPIFAKPGARNQHDLRGFRFFPQGHTVQWDWFFDINSFGPFPQPARRIDPRLSSSVSDIPQEGGGTRPLAVLNLLRSWRMGLPSGSAVAKAMGFESHEIDDPHEDMLFHYILREAELLEPERNSGQRLGCVGGTIVAEVFAGLLTGDRNSYVRNDPTWTPDDETAIAAIHPSGPINGNGWEVADLIVASGSPIDADDVDAAIGFPAP